MGDREHFEQFYAGYFFYTNRFRDTMTGLTAAYWKDAEHDLGLFYAYGPFGVLESRLPDIGNAKAKDRFRVEGEARFVTEKVVPDAMFTGVRQNQDGTQTVLSLVWEKASGRLHFFTASDWTLRELRPALPRDAGAFYASFFSEGALVFVTRQEGKLYDLYFLPWAAFERGDYDPAAGPRGVASPPGSAGAVRGLVFHGGAGSGHEQGALLLVTSYGKSERAAIAYAEAPLAVEGGKLQAALGSVVWARQEIIPPGPPDRAPDIYPHLGLDGRLYLWALCGGPLRTFFFRRDADGGWENLSLTAEGRSAPYAVSGLVAYTSDAMPPAIVYVTGEQAESPSEANRNLTDVTVPVWRIIFGLNDEKGAEHRLLFTWAEEFGKGRRTGLAGVWAHNKLILGVIEGPPPAPNENLNVASSLDPTSPRASTTLTDVKEETTGYDIDGSIAVVAEATFETGFLILSSTLSVSVTAGGRAGKKVVNTQTTTQFHSNELRREQDPATGRWRAQPQGTVILLGVELAGYTFEFLGLDGKPVEGAPVFTQIFPQGVEISAEPYVMNPHAGPSPGQLETYVVSDARRRALDENAGLTVRGHTHIFTSWGLTSSGGSTAKEFNSEQFSSGFFVDAKAMLGFKVNAFGAAKGELKAGVQIKLNVNWSRSTSDARTLTSTVSLPGNNKAVGTYYAYGYSTYLLKPSPQWAEDFLNGLVTDDWPPEGSADRKQNEALKGIIVPHQKAGDGTATHSAWKICYALGEAKRVREIETAAAEAGVELPAGIAERLARAGVTTTAQLHEALDGRAGGPKPSAAAGAAPALDDEEAELLRRLL